MNEEERLARAQQRFRNLVTALVVGSIVLVLAGLYVLLLPGAAGVAGGICAIGFLALALVAWEYLMKPGYGVLHRRPPEPEDEEPPASPRAP